MYDRSIPITLYSKYLSRENLTLAHQCHTIPAFIIDHAIKVAIMATPPWNWRKRWSLINQKLAIYCTRKLCDICGSIHQFDFDNFIGCHHFLAIKAIHIYKFCHRSNHTSYVSFSRSSLLITQIFIMASCVMKNNTTQFCNLIYERSYIYIYLHLWV